MKCPVCGAKVRFRGSRPYVEGIDDHARNTYLRRRICGNCGAKLVSAEVLFPEDRQDEELRRLFSLRYAKRAKPRRAQHT